MTRKINLEINAGFTLIELLVVVSIIAILMSILLLSLSKAKEAGRRIACSSNLKQLTLAWQEYAYDNQNKLCSPYTGFNTSNYAELSDEMKKLFRSSPRNWACSGPLAKLNTIARTEKELRGGEGTLEIEPGSNITPGTYHIKTEAGAIWKYLEDVDVYKCKQDKKGVVRSYSMSRIMGTSYQKISEIYEASEKAVFIDAKIATGGKWLFGPFELMMDLSSRHNNGCNLSFVDGHCEYRKFNLQTQRFLQHKISDFGNGNDDYDYFTMRLEKGKAYR